ncbi:MAG: MFS transporter [Bdellovibrionales bacterium RIFCSPHIGHO2_01_FULL_40_29]|nr:MAG: MFS transporter [Bdellovibrionales bacterium RIFCSPHIGHO2_01_FULL_40_29]OFZ34583.1 MAG: MFS transporter [Bdellovibrionales bacterium RIFCSPHIGHO2_02_FULL_40_15]
MKIMAFTRYQKFVIALLSFLQFTIVLDFMIMSPLGAMLMPALKISPQQFGVVVSVYAFSAGISGILASGFADRFDRKKILLFFYVGFVLGTFFCAMAPTYPLLLAARTVTGLFGGVIGSIVFAITTDLFPYEQRGRVMGFVQTSFAASQILGIPAGLYFSNLWGWHAPFLMIVAVSVFVGVIILMYLKPIDAHLKMQKDHNAFEHLRRTITTPRYAFAFATTALLSTGGFMLMPFGSAFTVHNLGIAVEKLPMIYLITGLCAIVTGPLVGRFSDLVGKFKVFTFGTVVSMILVVIYTNMGVSPLWMVVLVNAVLFVGIFSRMIPSQALMSAIPTPDSRGAFMAISSSLQQIAGGFAAVIAGSVVSERPGGYLEHFDTLGYILVLTTTFTWVMMWFINKSHQSTK